MAGLLDDRITVVTRWFDRHGFHVFAFCWNEALFASAITTQNAVTMPAFILASRDTQGIRFNFAAVNTILAISPPVLLSLLVQRYLARGLSFGAVKA